MPTIKRTLEELNGIIKGEAPNEQAIRDGVLIEKGAVLTESYLNAHLDFFKKISFFFTAYPDVYLDIIKPTDSNFSLFFYQRITLRALMRFKEIYVTAPRAFSKSFITIFPCIYYMYDFTEARI